jgi:hypothetical protein
MNKHRVNRLTTDYIIFVMMLEIHILPPICELADNPKPHKKGGYLTIRDRADGEILLVVRIGDFPHQKANKYLRLSLEKGERLYHHQAQGHVSSYQSRDEAKGRYGGAIIANGLIVSFSGLPEKMDELAVLALAKFLRWITNDQANEIAKISNNSSWPMLKFLG